MLQLAEAISGQVLNKQGVLAETKLNRAEVIKQVCERLSREPDNDDRVVWGRWFLADPATRTISPYSKLTVPEYIENRIKENTAESLDEAERLASGNAALLERIAKTRATPTPPGLPRPAVPTPPAQAVPPPTPALPARQPGVPASTPAPGATNTIPRSGMRSTPARSTRPLAVPPVTNRSAIR